MARITKKKIIDFFVEPQHPDHKLYEALRAFYVDGLNTQDISKKFHISESYFKKLKMGFTKDLGNNKNVFFQSEKKKGPQKRETEQSAIDKIVALRKQNHAITDIRVILASQNISISLDTIHSILKEEGFARLQKRTKQERNSVDIPDKIVAPECQKYLVKNEEFSTELNAGALIFMPLIQELGIIECIQKAQFPATKKIDDISSVLSFLALKLIGTQRYSHDTQWNLDRSLGLFAGLNVLPKNTTLSTYSYRVTREMNKRFLLELSKIFHTQDMEEFNLDFKTIPYWGDDAVLEKNWAGSKSKVLKSILSLIVQEPSQNGYLTYTDAEIKHRNESDAVLEFVDFWKNGHDKAPKMLIFDSKFTNYQNLNKLNADNIKFITIRRRGKALIDKLDKIQTWKMIRIERSKNKHQWIKIYDSQKTIRDYDQKIRQIVITDHGREKPTFLITNDLESEAKVIVEKYARRWLVEKEIAEQIDFFHLNNATSSIVVKVDFDLTLTLLAHNLYRVLARKLKGFESCECTTIFRKFLDNGAQINIQDNHAHIALKKKSHLPLLLDLPWFTQKTFLSWLNMDVSYSAYSST